VLSFSGLPGNGRCEGIPLPCCLEILGELTQ
jgi:hypothetical protein